MADFHVEFKNAIALGGSSIEAKNPRASQLVSNPASATETSITALAGEVAVITVTGGSGYVKIGQAGTDAASAPRSLIADGATRSFGPLQAGDIVDCLNV
jgi:hypothetical protein